MIENSDGFSSSSQQRSSQRADQIVEDHLSALGDNDNIILPADELFKSINSSRARESGMDIEALRAQEEEEKKDVQAATPDSDTDELSVNYDAMAHKPTYNDTLNIQSAA